jgi:hypothetical protein
MKDFTKFLLVSASLTVCLFSASRASAFTFNESGDAGQLLDTAQDVGNAGEIIGAIADFKDVDLFKLTIGQAGMTTFDGNPIKGKDGSNLNVNLFLFNAAGNPLFSLEPMNSNSMKFDFLTAAGTYFLGIGSDDLDALDAKGKRIAGNDSGIDLPNGVLAGWRTASETIGAYNIKISTVPDSTAVPTPALLPGLLGLGFKVFRRKKDEDAAAAGVATVGGLVEA